jgi:hypothetical protein
MPENTTTPPVVTPAVVPEPPKPILSGNNAPTVKTAAPVKEESEAMKVHRKIEEILHKYKGLESHIPTGHEYWGLLNLYRRLKSEE